MFSKRKREEAVEKAGEEATAIMKQSIKAVHELKVNAMPRHGLEGDSSVYVQAHVRATCQLLTTPRLVKAIDDMSSAVYELCNEVKDGLGHINNGVDTSMIEGHLEKIARHAGGTPSAIEDCLDRIGSALENNGVDTSMIEAHLEKIARPTDIEECLGRIGEALENNNYDEQLCEISAALKKDD
tara:strand:+ start:430 stop:981 length:552 start_codon:yes stop_codon:yes gene_type:complete